MSDFTHLFWSPYVAIVSLVGIVACLVLLWVTARKKSIGHADNTTGHVWDEDLKEMNNPLPLWWVGLFVITVFFGLAYLWLFPGLGGFEGRKAWTSQSEYEAEVQEANQALAPLYAQFDALPADQLAKDPKAMAIGQRLFMNNCSQCHGSDARGSKGYPNLTDADWLYGGDPETIKQTITHGRQGMMPPMAQAVGSPQDISNLAHYVLSLSASPHDSLKAASGKAKFTVCASCHGIFGESNEVFSPLVGGTTALVAALIALGQICVKRAMSFLVSSWLGLLFVAVGLGGIGVADHLLLVYPLPMALMLMSVGTIVISNVTQDLTQLGGLWSRRPLVGIAFLVGAAGLMGLPPFGGFAALRELLQLAANSQLPLVLGGLVLITNALLSASLMRVFGLIWGGRPTPFTARSPEVLWLMVLPTLLLMGLVLHIPQLLVHLGIYKLSPVPGWGPMGWPLVASTLIGAGSSAWFYLRPHPLAELPSGLGGLQHWLAEDMHTEAFYHRTIVALVVGLARLSAWSDLRLVDGFSSGTGEVALQGARRLSLTTSGRSQAYALSLVLGVLLMAAWLLAR